MVALQAVAVGNAGVAGPDRQYAGLKQQCVLYTDATRARYRMKAELLAQTCREIKEAVRGQAGGSTRHSGGQGPQDHLLVGSPGQRGTRLQANRE